MLVTGKPSMVLGMITSPPGPVYRVMVIVPLLVVKVNWACTTTGSDNSRSGSSHLAVICADRLMRFDWQVWFILAFLCLVLIWLRGVKASGGGRSGRDNSSTRSGERLVGI